MYVLINECLFVCLVCVGVVLGRGCGQREHAAGRVVVQRQLVGQLPRLAAQEELAERALALHQEHHGTILPHLLIIGRPASLSACVCVLLL